ncbi:MAG TPA: L-histidine N(alpha)-methyltransferase [Pyrinomonadaceae bacterium]|jgi:uncharacterized SAM-dependent methyltransferase|nr:L-histidine N(alpha)-methyltransferase [Pyrinomonadaceae bacterium]
MPHPTSEDICLLPEYYLTRAESEIFARRSDETAELAAQGSPLTLCEPGSGSASKQRPLIEALLRTENSHKYDLAELSQLAAATGFECARTWLDSNERFSSNLFVAGGD